MIGSNCAAETGYDDFIHLVGMDLGANRGNFDQAAVQKGFHRSRRPAAAEPLQANAARTVRVLNPIHLLISGAVGWSGVQFVKMC